MSDAAQNDPLADASTPELIGVGVVPPWLQDSGELVDEFERAVGLVRLGHGGGDGVVDGAAGTLDDRVRRGACCARRRVRRPSLGSAAA